MDISSGNVLFGESCLPQEAFISHASGNLFETCQCPLNLKNLRKKNLSSSSISVNKTNNLLQTLMTRVTISVVTYLSFTSSFTDLLSVAFGITLIAVELFCLNQCLISILSTDMTERTLIVTAFEFAKGIAELKLTEGELGLYSAFILFDPSKYLLHGVHGYSINS